MCISTANVSSKVGLTGILTNTVVRWMHCSNQPLAIVFLSVSPKTSLSWMEPSWPNTTLQTGLLITSWADHGKNIGYIWIYMGIEGRSTPIQFPLEILKATSQCFVIVWAEWETWLPCGFNALPACTVWMSPCPILKDSHYVKEWDWRLGCVKNKGRGSSCQTFFIWDIKVLSDGDRDH